jgi:D-serine dehydratase
MVVWPVVEVNALLFVAIACSALSGAAGILLGLRVGVRSVQRDVGLNAAVQARADDVAREIASLRLEWATATENLEQLAAAVEKGRRRAAASRSAAEKAVAAQEDGPPLTSAR